MMVRWLLVSWLLAAAFPLAAQAPEAGRDYLLFGAATDAQTPMRGCPEGVAERLPMRLMLPPPEGGWSGKPQAVEVFNAFYGEVMIHHGARIVCGHAQDARTRDSRFRSGIGMVVVPPAGSRDPIVVAWERPLKPGWIPSVRLGEPSMVQQRDTERLLVRTTCLAIALVMALSAGMGFLATRNRNFLVYALACVLLMLWQAVFSGLSGYPEPWLPIGDAGPQWLVSMSALAYGTMGWLMWWLCGGWRLLPGSRGWLRGISAMLLVIAMVAAWLHWRPLAVVAVGLDHAFAAACVLSFVVGILLVRRRGYHAIDGVVAILPLVAMVLADLSGVEKLVQYRIESMQLALSWFLVVAAFSLNRGLGLLRQQRDEMQQLADTDALTGLPNRRAGLRQLEHHLRQARERRQPLSIGFLDIDLFKQINDRHGHDVGDQVLVSVAHTLAAGVRHRNDVIRMGGEEFLILLPGASADAALPRLEQLRGKIRRRAQELGRDGLEVTVSIGLAELRPEDGDVAALLRRADTAMYHAKRGGRDRVVDARDVHDAA